MSCAICEGRETIESTVRYQLIAEGTPDLRGPLRIAVVPLCKSHCTEAEIAYREVKRIQTAPVTINLPGLKIGGAPGRT